MSAFNFRNPDYSSVFQARLDALGRMRANPSSLPAIKAFYKSNPARFINDFGIALNPKNVERGLPSLVPFILYPKQVEWVEWVVDHWRNQRPGLTEKTRQMGFSWLSMALACTLCLFHDGMAIGVGSRKQEYCDVIGDPKSLIQKAREFMRNLPREFRGSWDIRNHSPHMRIMFPDTNSIIAAEAGDNVGRGATTSLYFVDESAFLERPMLVEASLSQTSNCRIDISTPNGMANPFAQKRHSGTIDVFSFHWRDDPTKDDAWYAKQLAELDPVTIAREIDIDYTASVENVLIPSAWVQAAINAHVKLGIAPTGERGGSLDVADEGKDANAFVGTYGPLIEVLEEWSGTGGDIFKTVQRAFHICDENTYGNFRYDADGLGAGVRGDARIINDARVRKLRVDAFRGSASPFHPESEDVKGRKNKDFFSNCKAQSWWSLRTRFQSTYRAVIEGASVSPDDIISIPANLKNRQKLCMELSQPTFSINNVGRIVIDKSPEGTKSPNLADAVMMQFSPSVRMPMVISSELLQRVRRL